MTSLDGIKIGDRNGRYVRRARLSVPSGAPRHTLVSSMEEALRLSSLPGENEGRTYYFRFLRVTGLPCGTDRRTWLDSFQRALSDQAAAALHAASPRADQATAVYFRSHHEALEILLRRIVERRAVTEWFWPMVTVAAEAIPIVASSPAHARIIPAVVEELRATPASWIAVAAALFAAPEVDFVYLLRAIPDRAAGEWLTEMDGRRPVPPAHTRPGRALAARRALHQALEALGFESPRTVWLVAMAILHESPAELGAGTLVERARMILQECAASPDPRAAFSPEQRAAAWSDSKSAFSPKQPAVAWSDPVAPNTPPETDAMHSRPLPSPAPLPEPESECGRPSGLPPGFPVGGPVPGGPARRAEARQQPGRAVPTEAGPWPQTPFPRHLLPGRRPPTPDPQSLTPGSRPPGPGIAPNPSPWHAVALPTNAAGLFFLLNGLERLGIASALASGLADAWPDYVAQILEGLAVHAGTDAGDPIRLWLASLSGGEPGEPTQFLESSWLPSNLGSRWGGQLAAGLRGSPKTGQPRAWLLRVWLLAVRRYCWRAAKITVREIVTRPGLFSVDRAEIDVSLPLDEAEIRIRRVGLDLDPGWLPWFGRVVRFHYLYLREFHG